MRWYVKFYSINYEPRLIPIIVTKTEVTSTYRHLDDTPILLTGVEYYKEIGQGVLERVGKYHRIEVPFSIYEGDPLKFDSILEATFKDLMKMLRKPDE